MNELKKKYLSGRKFYGMSVDNITFARRVAADHIFTSVDEAVKWLNDIIDCNSFTDDILPVEQFDISNDLTKTFIINTVEESIVSIIHEIIQQLHRNDTEFLGYIRTLIDNTIWKINDHIYKKDYKENGIWFYGPLLRIVDKISYLCDPIFDEHEESSIAGVANAYYSLMVSLHAAIHDEYNHSMISAYKRLIDTSDITREKSTKN
jgi:effector-binding domain-containing protein